MYGGVIIWIYLCCLTILCVTGTVTQGNRTGCVYHGLIEECLNTNLSYIPYTPGYIQTLYFHGNQLHSVTKDTFKSVENPSNLRKLSLQNNSVVRVTQDAFSIFSRLYWLDLSFNHIHMSDLMYLLPDLSINNNLYKLVLKSMGRNTISDTVFSLLERAPASNLFLGNNEIAKFSMDTLRRLNGIQEINLFRNKITTFVLPEMSSLIALQLSFNKLVGIPNFCSENEKTNSLAPKLKYLYLNHNYITSITNQTCRCLPELKRMQLRKHEITTIPSYVVSLCRNIEAVYLSRGTAYNFNIEPFAFSSKTLESLSVGYNGLAKKVFKSLPEIFKELPNLKRIEISFINMFDLSDVNISELFSPLNNLRHIDCYNCQIQGELTSVLNNKPNLTDVRLRGNHFRGISPGIFCANSNIVVLELGINDIGHVSPEALPIQFLNKLDKFEFSKNPLICDCKLEWLINWMKATTKSRLKYYPNGYTCAQPAKWAHTMTKDVRFSYFECHPFNTEEWIGMVGGPIVLIVIIIVVVLYRNRWKLKHYIYMMRKRRDYEQLNGHEYIYDVFVAYSYSEREWVINVLIPLLEDEHNLKTCVHDRDFQPGAFINDNIVERMHESKNILLIISNTFATSDWCVFEMQVAHSMHIEREKKVVVVLFEDILGRNMNPSLKVLLESTTYLEWTDNEDGQALFTTKLKDSFVV